MAPGADGRRGGAAGAWWTSWSAPRVRSRRLVPSWAAMRAVRRERWTARAAVGRGRRARQLLRDLPGVSQRQERGSAAPARRSLRRQLTNFDRGLFGGNDPAALLHSLLGHGHRRRGPRPRLHGLLLLCPDLAPARPGVRPAPAGRHLLRHRASRSTGRSAPRATCCSPPAGRSTPRPATSPTCPRPMSPTCRACCSASGSSSCAIRWRPDAHQGIAAFGSLHTSIIFTAAVAAHLLGLGRRRADRAVDAVRADHHRHRLLRLALRGRRPGRRGHRR